jgi:hypothetical protein
VVCVWADEFGWSIGLYSEVLSRYRIFFGDGLTVKLVGFRVHKVL